jgi:hypothetical protein
MWPEKAMWDSGVHAKIFKSKFIFQKTCHPVVGAQ